MCARARLSRKHARTHRRRRMPHAHGRCAHKHTHGCAVNPLCGASLPPAVLGRPSSGGGLSAPARTYVCAQTQRRTDTDWDKMLKHRHRLPVAAATTKCVILHACTHTHARWPGGIEASAGSCGSPGPYSTALNRSLSYIHRTDWRKDRRRIRTRTDGHAAGRTRTDGRTCGRAGGRAHTWKRSISGAMAEMNSF